MQKRYGRSANLKRKFSSLLNAKEDEELFYDKERVVKKAKPEVYVYYCSLRACQLKMDFVVALGESSTKHLTRDNDLGFPVSHHDTAVHGARYGDPGTSQSGDPDGPGHWQRTRASLGRRNGGEPFAFYHPCLY